MPPERVLALEASLRPGVSGRLFCVSSSAPPGPPPAGVLFVHAFAEEMNKSRHVVAQAARALAGCGLRVEVPDLLGCGDSEGTLADVTIELWLEDLEQLVQALARQVEGPVHIWGMRAGALLAAALCQRLGTTPAAGDLVLWQPVLRGRQVLSEFLRLRAAAGLFNKSAPRETSDGLRERLRAGECIEVAGYELAPALADGLDALVLAELTPGARPVHWFEVMRDISREPSPAVRGVREAWRAAGTELRLQQVPGPAFWSAGELEDCPALVAATVDALCAAKP